MPDITRLPKPLAVHYEWQNEAACRGMDSSVFFHPPKERERDRGKRIAAAKEVCAECPVVAQCRAHALTTVEPYGIWGGMSEDERAKALGLRSVRYPGSANG